MEDLVKDEWKEKAYTCHGFGDYPHSYIPVSWAMSERSKHVTALMCTKCFHQVNVHECHKFKDA